jgi:hypothetical protein
MPPLSLRPAPMVASLPSRSFSSLSGTISQERGGLYGDTTAAKEEVRAAAPRASARSYPATGRARTEPAEVSRAMDLSELTAGSLTGTATAVAEEDFFSLPSPPLPSAPPRAATIPVPVAASSAFELRSPGRPADWQPRAASGSTAQTPARDFDRQLALAFGQIIRFARGKVVHLPRELWFALPGRRLLLTLGAVGAIAWGVLQTPLVDWSRSRMAALAQDFRERAAFQFVDDFTHGVGTHWTEGGLESASEGALIRSLALSRSTVGRDSYRFDFDAKVPSRSLGWVIAAADERNYYAFQLEQVRARGENTHRLTRYQVIDGKPQEPEQIGVREALSAGEYARVSVRFRDGRATTFINGQGVDYLELGQNGRGGVGFLASGREPAVVRQAEISGNEDNWGLFLFGFLELLADARKLASEEPFRTLLTRAGAEADPPPESSASLTAAR